MPKLKEGPAYQCSDGVLNLTTFPKELQSLDLSQEVEGGPVRKVELGFDRYGKAGERIPALQEVILPPTLEELPLWDIALPKVQEINIPASCKKIGAGSFAQWSALKAVALPHGVKKVPASCFRNCKKLAAVELPSSVTSIDKAAFSGCASLKSIRLPAGVRTIGQDAFSGCKMLQEITFPNGLEKIEKNAFKNCKALGRVDLPASAEYDKTSFPDATAVFVDGKQVERVADELHICFSSVALYSEPVDPQQLEAGRPVIVHAMEHLFTVRLEVVAENGAHLGFLASTEVSKLPRFRTLSLGQAFAATLEQLSEGKWQVVFAEDTPLFNTPFPERTVKYGQKTQRVLPAREMTDRAVLFYTVKAPAMKPIYENVDAYVQQEEYAKAYSQEEAERIFVSNDNWKYAPEPDTSSDFYNSHITDAILEQIPCGTELGVSLDAVHLPVDNGSWAYMHAGGNPDEYPYPMPAFVFSWNGVRFADIPAIYDHHNAISSYCAIAALWEWGKRPTLRPRAWLIGLGKPEYQGGTAFCEVLLSFEEGGAVPQNKLNIREALRYVHRDDEPWEIPAKQILQTFAETQRINLTYNRMDSASVTGLDREGRITWAPEALYQTETETYLMQYREPAQDTWITLDRLEALANKEGPSLSKEGTDDYEPPTSAAEAFPPAAGGELPQAQEPGQPLESPAAEDEKPERPESATKAEQNEIGAAVTQSLKETTANAGKNEQATSEKADSLNKYRINLYVILTNEEKLGKLHRAQKDFLRLYKNSLILPTNPEIIRIRKELLDQMEAGADFTLYRETFKQRPLRERFDLSTRNLYAAAEEPDRTKRANWAIENTKEWFREAEQGEIRAWMDDELAKERKLAESRMDSYVAQWNSFEKAKDELMFAVFDESGKDSICEFNNNFQVLMGSVLVEVRLYGEESSYHPLVDNLFPWYWGVTTRDVWETALGNGKLKDFRDPEATPDAAQLINQAADRIRAKFPELKVAAPATFLCRENIGRKSYSASPQVSQSSPQQPAKEGCYIATAVYGSYDAPQVLTLRRFRDGTLRTTSLGRWFIRTYYRLSPPLARRLKRARRANALVRALLDRLVEQLNRKRPSADDLNK